MKARPVRPSRLIFGSLVLIVGLWVSLFLALGRDGYFVASSVIGGAFGAVVLWREQADRR